MDIVNFAHGTFVMIAMYAGYVLWTHVGIDPFLSILITAPVFFGIGVITERLVIAPIIDRPMFAQVFATVGLLWILEHFALFWFGPSSRGINAGYGGLRFGGIVMEEVRLYGFVITFIVTALLYLFLYRTKTGLGIRATAQSDELAQPYGININRIYMLTFGLGIALVGIAGSVLIGVHSVRPTTGNLYVLTSFVIVTLGGLGSIGGVLLAGFFIGILDAFISFYFSSALAPPVYFVLFIGVLVLRAEGKIVELRYHLDRLRWAVFGGRDN
jgi:branched-chain amino acid transport system permease protein